MSTFKVLKKLIINLSIFLVIFTSLSIYCYAIPLPFFNPYDNFKKLQKIYEMKKAFQNTFSNMSDIEMIIEQMFNKSINDPNPKYVFMLPDRNVNQTKIVMYRDDFDTPIYPNITISDVILYQILKAYKHNNNLQNNNLPEYKTTSRTISDNVLNTQGIDLNQRMNNNETNEWDLLGLHGWEGTLRIPQKSTSNPNYPSMPNEQELTNISSLNINQLLSSLYRNIENNENIWNLPDTETTVSYPLFESPIVVGSQDTSEDNSSTTLMKQNYSDSDIYIGRANSPFGYSTKWNIKNQTLETDNDEQRSKRAIIELYSIIKCTTGCDPLIFKGYGCYCGFSGSGRPIDSIDRCCRLHDACYEKSVCPSFIEYFVPYLWKCYKGKPLCAIENGVWGKGHNSCSTRLCQCDLFLAKCLQKYTNNLCPKKKIICKTSKIRSLQNLLGII